MKSKDQRSSQATQTTSVPFSNFALDSNDLIQNGHKIKNFYKIKINSLEKNKFEKGLLSAKQNNFFDNANIIYSQRPHVTKSTSHQTQFPKKSSQNALSSRPSKVKSKKVKPVVFNNLKQIEQKVKSKTKNNKVVANQKSRQKTQSSQGLSSRKLIMSTMDNKTLQHYITRQKIIDKLRSITEQSQVILKAKRISQKRPIKKPRAITSSLNHTHISKIQSFITTQTFSNQDQFDIFKQSIDEVIQEQLLDESIQSLRLQTCDMTKQILQDMRYYEQKNPLQSLNYKILNEKSLKQLSAKKIQDCWKRFKTRQIISNQHRRQQMAYNLITESYESAEVFNIDSSNNQVPSLKFNQQSSMYEYNNQQQKSERNAQETKILKEIQLHQGKKWAEIPQLVEAYLAKNNSQQDTRSLLQKIASISQRNKQQLLKNASISQQNLSLKQFKYQLKQSQLDEQFKSSRNSQVDELGSFNFQKYSKLVNQDGIIKFVKYRKNLLNHRFKTEMNLIEESYTKKKISKSQFNKRKQLLEQWALQQGQDIDTTKRYLQIGYKRVKQSIKKIQFDYSKILKLKGQSLKHCCYSSSSLRRLRDFRKKPIKINKSINKKQSINYSQQSPSSQHQISVQSPCKQNIDCQKSIISQLSSQRVLKRQSNTPLHKLGSQTFSDSDDDSSLDLEQFAQITLHIQIKNWLDRFKNKDQIKQRIIQSIIEAQIVEACKQLKQKQLDIIFSKQEQQQIQKKGVQTDIQTVRYFLSKMKKYLQQNNYTNQYCKQLLKKQNKTSVLDSLFPNIWKNIQSQLEFPQTQHYQKQLFQAIAQSHYQSIFDAFNETLLKKLEDTNLHSKNKQLQLRKMNQCYCFSEERVISNASLLCGLFKRNIVISVQDLQYVRSQRINQMIDIDIIEQKPWRHESFSEPIKCQISTLILDQLILQTLCLLK